MASLGIRTRASAMGVLRHNHHATNYCCVPNFTIYLFLLPQSRTDIGYISISSHCTRHFSVRHHASVFSRVYPLGGEGRHAWQIVRQLSMKAGWWDAPLTNRDLAMSNLHAVIFFLETVICMTILGKN